MYVTKQAGAVVVVDLTDTLLQPHEAAAVFTVLVQQLQAVEADSKLLVLDSAHEYLTAAAGICTYYQQQQLNFTYMSSS